MSYANNISAKSYVRHIRLLVSISSPEYPDKLGHL